MISYTGIVVLSNWNFPAGFWRFHPGNVEESVTRITEKIMLSDDRSILRTTFEGLESGLSVWHIATFPILTCNFEDSVDTVFNDPRWINIDFIPVKKGDAIVGVVERPPEPMPVTINKVMLPLSEGFLVASRMPLKEFLPKMLEPPFFRLVLQGTEITRIVTRSDIQKLPVRILAFGLVTHLEMSMARLINSWFENNEEEWLTILGNRRTNLEDKFENLRSHGLEISILEATELCDKITISKEILRRNNMKVRGLGKIDPFRNTIAHARNYAESNESLRDFLQKFTETEDWIHKIEGLLGAAQPYEET